MYAWPVDLPAMSNREDLVHLVGLFDDDTGEAIDVSGRTLANAGDFTAAAWTVTSGVVVTASATQLTIKDYPFGNEMQALALTVGQGLAISAGDPVTIADATGLNTMTGYVTSYVAATGAMVAQIGCAFDFEISGQSHGYDGGYGGGYGTETAIGTSCDASLITAQLGSGISVVDLGKVLVKIPAATIQKLHNRTYRMGFALSLGGEIRQIALGTLPVIGGGLRRSPFG